MRIRWTALIVATLFWTIKTQGQPNVQIVRVAVDPVTTQTADSFWVRVWIRNTGEESISGVCRVEIVRDGTVLAYGEAGADLLAEHTMAPGLRGGTPVSPGAFSLKQPGDYTARASWSGHSSGSGSFKAGPQEVRFRCDGVDVSIVRNPNPNLRPAELRAQAEKMWQEKADEQSRQQRAEAEAARQAQVKQAQARQEQERQEQLRQQQLAEQARQEQLQRQQAEQARLEQKRQLEARVEQERQEQTRREQTEREAESQRLIAQRQREEQVARENLERKQAELERRRQVQAEQLRQQEQMRREEAHRAEMAQQEQQRQQQIQLVQGQMALQLFQQFQEEGAALQAQREQEQRQRQWEQQRAAEVAEPERQQEEQVTQKLTPLHHVLSFGQEPLPQEQPVAGGGGFASLQPIGAESQQSEIVRREAEAGQVAATHGEPTAASPVTATENQPRVNSLGMKFVPVPGTKVLFCIWDTRVSDYRVYSEANDGVDGRWRNPEFGDEAVTPQETCPVVEVSWEDAKKFCEWLTKKERSEGLISGGESYRLPTDWEWSAAVGLKEKRGGTPSDKNWRIKDVYPWGTHWPPPRGAGNYDRSLNVDKFSCTSPVGSFNANQYGLYDMGGNVWQWCEDWYDNEQKYRVSRGASWFNLTPGAWLSSCRNYLKPDYRNYNIGFRCVLASGD